ncbi:MAG TPA: helicase-related protein, partial [Xanthomonadales bacterium]|nr:helicase-related protein [Xanthomonadales bacterium]
VQGSLSNEILRNPTLAGKSGVMLDEVDALDPVLLAELKGVQEMRKQKNLPQLKLVVTSGTMDTRHLEEYLTDNTATAKVVEVKGHEKKIYDHFLDKPISPEDVPVKAAEMAKNILDDKEQKGDVLIFMPGRGEIRKAKEKLESLLDDSSVEIVTLTGGEQGGNPYDIINNNPKKARRVFFSTDVAERGITVPDVIVIDSGLMKKMVYDPKTRLTTLVTMSHTKDNQTQRKGRAGRTGDGHYYALYTKAELVAREAHQTSDFLRSDLIPDVLRMKAGGRDIYNYDYPHIPEQIVLDQAVEALQKLGALDKDGNITAIGQKMAGMDEDPQVARMLIEAEKRNCLSAVTLLVGAMKTNDSIFEIDSRTESLGSKYAEYVDPDSDFITFLNGWNAYVGGKQDGFNIQAIEAIKRERNKLRRGSSSADVVGIPVSTDEQKDAINLCIASGTLDKVMEVDSGSYKLEGAASSGIKIDKASGLYGKGHKELLSGKMLSTQKKGRSPNTSSSMNMKFDKERLLSEFDYLSGFFESKQPNNVENSTDQEPIPEAPKAPVEPSDVTDDALGKKLVDTQQNLVNTPTISTKAEAKTLIEKVRASWHKLTDKVKEMFIKFKNSVKKIFGI